MYGEYKGIFGYKKQKRFIKYTLNTFFFSTGVECYALIHYDLYIAINTTEIQYREDSKC